MKLIHRLGFYFTGFVAGIIILIFFLSGKKTSCDYGPSSRVLKALRQKEKIYTDEAKNQLSTYNLDTLFINSTLENGEVIFSESETSLDTCSFYVIESELDKNKYKSTFKNCDSLVTVLKINKLKN